MFITISKPFEILLPIVRTYLQPIGPMTGGSVKEKEAELRGKRNGLAEALAFILTERRSTHYEYVGVIKQVDSWDVEKRLREFLPDWPAPDKDGTMSLLEEAVAKLLELAYDDDTKKENDEKRRELILSGMIDPSEATPDDLDFFKKEHEAAMQRSAVLGSIVNAEEL